MIRVMKWTEKITQFLKQRLLCPKPQRVRLIQGLLASLANPEDFWEQQLADELNRRHKQVKEGTAEPISWADLKKQLKK